MTQTIEQVMAAITDPSDGPVTVFVMMMRALRLAASGADADMCGNALAEAMIERGDMTIEQIDQTDRGRS